MHSSPTLLTGVVLALVLISVAALLLRTSRTSARGGTAFARARRTTEWGSRPALILVALAVVAGSAVVATGLRGSATTNLAVTISNGGTGDVALTSSTYGHAKSVINAATTALTLPLPIPDLPSSVAVTNASAVADDPTLSVVVQGDVTVNGYQTSLQLSAVWPNATSSKPAIALAVKPGTTDLAGLNSLWANAPVNPTLTGAVVLMSPTAGTPFDTAKLPAAAQAFFPVSGPMIVGQGIALVATLDASSDPSLSHALAALGEGTNVTIRGSVGFSVAPLFGAATAAQKAGLDLSVTASGTPTSPSWITARTSTVRFSIPSGGSPSVLLTDSMTTNINGAVNTFDGSAAFDKSTFGKTTVSLAYGLKAGSTLAVPFGLGGLTLASPGFTLSATTAAGSTTFAGDFGVDVTLPTAHTVHLDAAFAAASGTLSASFSLAGTVTSADVVAFGNALLGTSVDGSSLGSAVTLTNAGFSFTKDTTSQTLALTASANIRSLTADVLVSLRHTTGTSPTLLLGLQVHDTGSSCKCITVGKLLSGSLSGAVGGLTLPQVELLGSVGFGSGSVSVPTASLSATETGFLSRVYATLPTAITLSDKLTFAGDVTVPDAIGAVFGMASGSQVVLKGDLGINLGAFGTGTTAPALSGSLTASLPAMTATLPSWLGGASSTTWSLSLAADSGGTIQLGLSTDTTINATINGTAYTVSVSGAVATGTAGTTIDLAGTVLGTFPIFGATWLSATNPAVHLHLDTSKSGTSFSASIDTTLTIGGKHAKVVASVSDGNGAEGSIEVTLLDPVNVSDVASAFGGIDVSSLGSVPSLTITALDAKFADGSKGLTFDLTASTSLTLPNSTTPFTSNLLLSVGRVNGVTQLLAGIETTSTVHLSDVLGASNLPSGVDFTFPQLGVLVAHPATTVSYGSLAGAQHDFFTPFCGASSSACASSPLALVDGVTIVSKATIPTSLKGLLAAASSDTADAVLVTGSLPIFGGPASGFALTVALPTISGAPGTPDFFESGGVSMSLSTTSISLTGRVTFNIPKGSSVTDSTTCVGENGVWRTARGGSTFACYDQVPFDLTAAADLSGIPSMTLTGGLGQGYTWHAPMGQTWLTLSHATVEFGIAVTVPGPTLTLGFAIGFAVANHDFLGAIKASLTPVEAPPFVIVNLIGFRVGSQSGLAMQDLVDIGSAVSGQSLSLGGIPNLAVRKVDFGFSEQNDPALCLVQGLHIAGELYINPSGPGITAGDACTAQPTNLATDCQNDSAGGCFAAIDVAINSGGMHASGTLGAFAVGPISFGGALVDLEVSPTVQRLVIKGAVDIQDFASGSLDLLVSSSELHFRGHASLFKGTFDAYLDGNATYSLTSLTSLKNPPSFSVNAVLKADFLNGAAVAMSSTLQALKPAIQAIDVVLTDILNGQPLDAIVDIPIQLANMGVSLPDPLGSSLRTISDTLKSIKSGIDALGHVVTYGIDDVLNGFTLSFPGLDGTIIPATCLGTISGGSCYSIPPFCAGFLGCSSGVPGVTVPETCLFTYVGSKCYSVPPITGVHIPGICTAIGLSNCSFSSLTSSLIMPALRQAFLSVTGYDVGSLDLTTVLNSISNALGSGNTVAIDCAQFKASLALGSSPTASVSLASDINLFGNHLNFGLGWNFAPTGFNLNSVLDVLKAIITPDTSIRCTGLPADWDTNASFPDAAGTGPPPPPGTPVTTPPPTPTLNVSLASAGINEGSAATLNGTLFPAPTSAHSVSINWGNGDAPTSVTTSTATFTATHTYGNNVPLGRRAVQYAISAKDGTSGPSASTLLTVLDVAPTRLRLTPATPTAAEGVPFTLGGAFDDSSGVNTHTVTVDWGDTSQSTLQLAAGINSFTFPSHTWADENGANGGYPVTVTVVDDDGQRTAVTSSVTITDAAPTGVTVTPSATTIPEKQIVTYQVAFTDPPSGDRYTANVNWGDGSSSALSIGTARAFAISHQWSEADTAAHPDGRYPVDVTVTDDDNLAGHATTVTQAVTNVTPNQLSVTLSRGAVPLAAPATMREGDPAGLTVTGTFSDNSAADTHLVQIDWGTGWLGDRYQVLPLAAGVFGFTATREYGDMGVYPIVVTVTDDDNASTSVTAPVTISNVPPTAVINRTTAITTAQGVTLFFVHAARGLTLSERSTDPGSDDLTMAWNWGDGTPSTSTTYLYNPLVGPDPALSPQVGPRDITDTHAHTWAKACVYTVGLTTTDDNGASATDGSQLVVTGNATSPLNSGRWRQQYAGRGESTLPPATLACYLRIVDQLSGVFGTGKTSARTLVTSADAVRVLHENEDDGPRTGDLDRGLLTGWLNLANGRYDWNTPIVLSRWAPVLPFHVVMENAERVRLNPKSTEDQIEAQEEILSSLEHQPDGDGRGDGSTGRSPARGGGGRG